jgi:hypothetical protein
MYSSSENEQQALVYYLVHILCTRHVYVHFGSIITLAMWIYNTYQANHVLQSKPTKMLTPTI